MTAPVSKSVTFISRNPPYGQENAQICLELVLAAAVFDQAVSYLFLDDGVYQLMKSQQPDELPAKNLSANLQALGLYGVEKVYVDGESLRARNLTAADLAVEVEIVEGAELGALIRDADKVFNL